MEVNMDNNFTNIETVSLDSELWDIYRGAYGNITEDLEGLLTPEPEVPEHEKSFDISGQSDYMVSLDNIWQQLGHQMSFYSALYLALPYLTKIYSYWRKKDDFKMQILILTNTGMALSADIPYNHYDSEDKVPENIMDNYQKSILFFKEEAEDIFLNKLDMLKEYNNNDLPYICAAILALLGKREEAFIFILGCWSQCFPYCNVCDYLNENIELEYDIDDNCKASEGLNSVITPAPSVIGQWDNKSLDNTYVFLSNILHFLGDEKSVKKLQYYYGTYKCPGCGNIKDTVMSLAILGLTEG